MQKMSFPESIERIAWKELLCDSPIFDSSQKRLTFDTRRFDWTSDGQFLAEDGFLHFENVSEIIIEPNKINLEDLVQGDCRLAFYSCKLLNNGIELETTIEVNLWAFDDTFLILRIFADFLVWQALTKNE